MRTSATGRLRIAEIAVGGGFIGITLCPGKQGVSLLGPGWARDLAQDLDVIRDWGAAVVVTLIEDHEFRLLGVPQLGSEILAREIEWIHLPITDGDAP